MMLTVELLNELEHQWRMQKAPIASTVRPGASTDMLQSAFTDLGLRVPAEVRTWWGWHDGAERTEPHSTTMLGTGWSFFSIEHARAEISEQRERASSVSPDSPTDVWNWS